jgi:hypothetical protein
MRAKNKKVPPPSPEQFATTHPGYVPLGTHTLLERRDHDGRVKRVCCPWQNTKRLGTQKNPSVPKIKKNISDKTDVL